MSSVVVISDQPQMSVAEAEEIKEQIIEKVEGIRALLLDMYERAGWAALGYHSWDAFLQELAQDARTSAKYLRRINNAALLEDGGGHSLGTFKEGTIRPINETLSDIKGFSNIDRENALELALELAGSEDALTGVVAQNAAWQVVVEQRTPMKGFVLVDRMLAGEVSPKAANDICQIMRGSKALGVEHILAEVSDPELAKSIANVSSPNGEAWQELKETIEATGTMPTSKGVQVPIGKATNSQLIDYLNAPLNMERYEKQAIERPELHRQIANAAAQLMIEYYGIVVADLPDALRLDENAFEKEIRLYTLLQKAGLIT